MPKRNSESRIDYLEGMIQWISCALDYGSSLNDLYVREDDQRSLERIFSEALQRLQQLYGFSQLGIMLVEELGNDFMLVASYSDDQRESLQTEIDFQIDTGNFAWALGQTKASIVKSSSGHSSVILFVLATQTRVRGMFVGVLDYDAADVQELTMSFLTLLLQGVANVIENKQTYDYVSDHNKNLESIVAKRTQELEDARNDAEAANEAKSRFLANMSHEIRTPLTSIIGYSEWLQDDNISLEEQKEATESIQRTGRHLLAIINDILDLSKIESKKIEVEEMMVPLGGIVNEVRRLMLMNARSNGIEFKVSYQFPLPRWMVTDPTRLKQILLNLCGNAFKFTEQGSVCLDISFDVDTKCVCFSVRDTGIGIPAENLGSLFDSFTQADTSTTRRFGGTGLGLNISKCLAELLGGTITVSSEEGRGSCFNVMVSAGQFSARDMVEHENGFEVGDLSCLSGQAANDLPVLSGRVLLAEDNPDNQRLVQFHLSRVGADLTIVENGKEAVEKALEDDFDLVLMDMQMPEMDGVAATELLRQAGYSKPIVALTANAAKDDRERCAAAGCDDFLTKPIDKMRLNQVLSAYMKQVSEGDRSRQDLGGDNDEFKKLRQWFVAELPSRKARINAALNDYQWDELRTMMHQLKGASGGYGFHELGKIAGCIEAIIMDQSFTDVPALMSDFDMEFQRIVGE